MNNISLYAINLAFQLPLNVVSSAPIEKIKEIVNIALSASIILNSLNAK
ncbi:hypothetical protein [Sinanaerobacter chloroacetimidivorans]|uniref:Uncharacterized protein n=1 Tax=Sinanaerobacter chloroacetimidivorans TaxID=2818044 RepID=A0A8J8B418_9FIRM|nr:hypothetical protein [Sinanaerobacter chloroacetimidivorans]MBR0600292.1 hypothetical protein [Sinanaerobacter chloroacetimidivorans]